MHFFWIFIEKVIVVPAMSPSNRARKHAQGDYINYVGFLLTKPVPAAPGMLPSAHSRVDVRGFSLNLLILLVKPMKTGQNHENP